jgi:transposase/transposase IS116/IS110/IS902 family protein
MIFAGLDWGEQKHRLMILDDQGTVLEQACIDHEQYGLAALESRLGAHGPLEQVHVAIELHDSLLLDRLLRLGVKVYGLNPLCAQRARERFTPAGIKDDDRDAWSTAEFVRTSHQHLRPLKPGSPATLELQEWVHLREDWVQERQVHLQQLHAHLVRWHPQARQCIKDLNTVWALDLLEAFPTADAFAGQKYQQIMTWCKGRHLGSVTRDRIAAAAACKSPTVQPARNPAHAAEIRYRIQALRTLNDRLAEVEQALEKRVDQHADAAIFKSLPNAGSLTVAALLAGFGEDRDRWQDHHELQARWGTAPITIQSGKFRGVRRRQACDDTVHHAWLWFAFNTVRKEGCWAREHYQAKRKAGVHHYAALRATANRWVKIITKCWQDRTPYDEQFHQQRREQRMARRLDK